MKIETFILHDGLASTFMMVGQYKSDRADHTALKEIAWQKYEKNFQEGIYKVLALVELDYDIENQLFNAKVVKQKVAPPPKLVELNVCAKKEMVKKPAPKKKPKPAPYIPFDLEIQL